jgi:site-specific DNA recombinase
MAFRSTSRSVTAKTLVSTPVVRCAVYTRKSTTEGLDSYFNTLDAQREACEAYISSQRLEGWVLVPDRYDDGGFTGGNTDRPALRKLLSDIQNGQISCMVVYKVDRLSRSLLDFAKLMEVFDLHQVAFVSVTQQFNTATSMGRLILNVLLSFAQFEREIISERTSDKMCAARRKGKLLGGPPVLGYDIDRDRKRLVLNPVELQMVKGLFDLYLKMESMLEVAKEANRHGWQTKSHTSKSGKKRPGHCFNKVDVQRVLTNVTYIGQINHKGEIVQGEHPPIIEKSVFQKVQQLIKHNRHAGGKSYRHQHNALLKKLLRCGNCSAAMAHTYAKKKNKLYRYYLCTTKQKQGKETCDTPPLPAQEIEDHVVEMVKRIGKDPELVQQAFTETVEQRKRQQARLEQEQRGLLEERRQLENKIERLVAAIDSCNTPLATIGEQLRKAEELVSQIERRLAEIDEGLDQLESEAVDREHLVAVLERFGLLWEVLAENEKTRLINQLLESVVYDPASNRISLVFQPRAPSVSSREN